MPSPSILAVTLYAGLAAAAPRAARETPPRFEETARVAAIEVPVTVVDRDGQAVRGLTAADFEVYDENQLQTLSGFRVIDLEAAATIDGEPGPPAGQPAVADLGPAQRRHFLLLFDLTFASPAATLKARLAARQFVLEALHPTDLAAVATVSVEQGTRLVVTFTPDRAQLARGIDTLGYRPHHDMAQRVDPLRFVIDPSVGSIEGEGGGGSRDGGIDAVGVADQELREYLGVLSQQAERSDLLFDRSRLLTMTRTLQELARRLNSVEGQKQVVLFSEGFDSRLVLGRSTDSAEAQSEVLDVWRGAVWRVDNDDRYGSTEVQAALNRMIEEFRRAGCTIQAVDIGGLRSDADAAGGQRRNGKESLFVMADGTGGELFESANDLGQQLTRLLRHQSVTYLLTFERSDLPADGSYRRLRVKAKLPPGARLAHRSGYYAPRPFGDLDPLEKNLLASDGIASGGGRREIELDVLATAFRAGPQLAYAPIIIEVAGDDLLAGNQSGRLAVELYAYASNERGEMRDFFTQMVSFDLGPMRRAFLDGGLKYYGHLELPPGDYQVRVLVRNAETGRTGVAKIPLQVPVYERSDLALLPPLFFDTAGRWVMVRERSQGTEKASIVYPFTVNGEPYVPSARPSLESGQPVRLCLVAYNLGDGQPALEIAVLGDGGRPVPGGRLALIERTLTGIPGLDKLLASFETDGLASGSYTLRVALQDPATGVRATSSIPFSIAD